MRLWRVVKIIEELGLGAQEQTEELSEKLEQCQKVNEALRKEVDSLRMRMGKADVDDQH
jgi:regulator of replication initiation timing